MGIKKEIIKMSKEFLDGIEALIAKLSPTVADPEQMKADVLAAVQPHLDTIDKTAADEAAKEQADTDSLKADVETVKGDVADLQKAITDALQHLADGKPADAQAVLQSALPGTTGDTAGTTGTGDTGTGTGTAGDSTTGTGAA